MNTNPSPYSFGKGQFIGVVPPMAFKNLWYPKQLLLMFDKLAIDLANNLSAYENKIIEQSRNEIDWLADEGLLTTLSGIVATNQPDLDKNNVSISGGFLLPGNISRDFTKLAKTTVKAYNGLKDLRSIASNLRTLVNVDAVAVGLPETPVEVDKEVDRETVIRITLHEFPAPSDATSWENILDFKNRNKSQEHFSRLKVWINKMGTKGLKGFEVADELRAIIHGYENQMKLSEMKLQKSVLEVMVTTTAEIAESLIRLKPSAAVKALFQVKNQRLTLLEEERKSAGREIAYIVNAKKQFR